LEISLVVAIIAAYLVKTDSRRHLPEMWIGVGAAALASIASGFVFDALIGAETSASSGAAVVLGGFIGVVVSIVIGVAFYVGSARFDLRRFFQYTGLLLVLFATGMFAKGLHEFRELLGIEWGFVSDLVWNVTSGPFAEGSTMHDFVKGLFGWSPNPERIRVVGYLAYLAPVTWFFYRDSTPKRSSVDSSERSLAEVS
jgi:high-affinity iron transporter